MEPQVFYLRNVLGLRRMVLWTGQSTPKIPPVEIAKLALQIIGLIRAGKCCGNIELANILCWGYDGVILYGYRRETRDKKEPSVYTCMKCLGSYLLDLFENN